MFLALEAVTPFFQSADGAVEAGFAELGPWPVYYAYLGNRPLRASDLQGLVDFMTHLLETPPDHPLLLLSNCPGIEADLEAEQQGMVFQAGEYRRLQQDWKAQGGQLISVIHERAVGGTYLLHGLAAEVRVAVADTQLYGALPPEQYQVVTGKKYMEASDSLRQAVNLGMVREVVELSQLKSFLMNTLKSWCYR